MNCFILDHSMNILLNDVVQDLEAIHGILFAAKIQFRNAIMERPTVPGPKGNPKLYDGEATAGRN